MYRDTAFSGEGARLQGGRFNAPGRRVVYTSASLSLAMLEMLVQANDRRRLKEYLCIPVTFDARLVTVLDASDLPDGWDARPYTEVSQAVGDAWLDEAVAAVLRVPSVTVMREHNYLLNPEHAAFGQLVIGAPEPTPFDARLLR